MADGFIYRLLENLLILDGERLSYRTLDVEQIGSVYEAIMGYEVEMAGERSIAVKPKDVVVGLDTLLAAKPADRVKRLKDEGELTLTGKSLAAFKQAETMEEMLAALGRRVSERTQQVLMPGSLYLQPGEERRRTGSHYTPRKLTQPIVETTLEPVLAQLGPNPTAEMLLELKVCDLAMGSAAFLVEACRQLGDAVVAAWDVHGSPADLPDAIAPTDYARRLVAQRCLYGVDKNPFAVNLAKLSLWLMTLAKDLPFTFVDHALKCGDSLVGLTRKEIMSFGRDPIQDLPLMKHYQEEVLAAKVLRSQIQAIDTRSDAAAEKKRTQLAASEQKLLAVRMQGDMAVAAFFDGCGKSKKDRVALAEEYGLVVRQQPERMIEIVARLRDREKPVVPFNWEIEFPEVFDREENQRASGFDAIVGNPPFAGKNTTVAGNAENYLDYLKAYYPESHGNSDVVAYFFRQAFDLLKGGGSLGLIATNTIAQGDTRSTGLRFICQNGGMIYNATRRYKWPGLAAVVVSVVHVFKSVE